MKRAESAASTPAPEKARRPARGIDSVRIRANLEPGCDALFVEVAILDPLKPRDLELTIVNKSSPDKWAVIDVADLLNAIQVIRATGKQGES